MKSLTAELEVESGLIDWVMTGDVAIQYQVSRDLLHAPKSLTDKTQKQIAVRGWGARFLGKQKSNGHWGITFYQPKWTSTHYTLLDLKTIGLANDNPNAQKAVEMVMNEPSGETGGINLARSLKGSDVCVNGMILNYASYFLPAHQRLKEIVDYLLQIQMADGGWNCRYADAHTTHSSMHSTLSVLEGLLSYRKASRTYRLQDIKDAEKKAVEFLLRHKLYQSHRTGKIIDQRYLRLSFPGRWRYDILRCLDYLQEAKIEYDPRMRMALDILYEKQDEKGKWPLQERHKGLVHFHMERLGQPSRWNTLRALRVLKHFKFIDDQPLL
ncbi:MAG TPA: prenyltransferase/squalene oxidase repeat-containing protein [Chryseosolibacter sp.]